MMNDRHDHFSIINLNPAEINNPLMVLAEFFHDDWLPGHLERLQSWRKCVLEEGYFKGDKGSPAELLYFQRLNVCLLEAAYLLKDSDAPLNTPSPEQEKKVWRYFPVNLKEVELLNPYLVLIRLFKAFDHWFDIP
jgi:hypothetical protein